MNISTDRFRQQLSNIVDWLFLTDPIPEEDSRYKRLKALVEEGDPLTENEQNIVALAMDNYVYNRETEKRRRRSTIESRVLYGVVVALMVWLSATYAKIDDAQDTSAKTAIVARDLSIAQADLIEDNRKLIEDLNHLVDDLDSTNKRQCDEIESLKEQIRAVLLSSPRRNEKLLQDAVRRFAPKSCKMDAVSP